MNSPLPSAKEKLEKGCEKLQLGSTCAIFVTKLSGDSNPKPPGPPSGGPKQIDIQGGSLLPNGITGSSDTTVPG